MTQIRMTDTATFSAKPMPETEETTKSIVAKMRRALMEKKS